MQRMSGGRTGSAAPWVLIGVSAMAIAAGGAWWANVSHARPSRSAPAPVQSALPAPVDTAPGAPVASVASPGAEARAGSACPAGMLLVEGTWCPFVGHRCVDWINEKADRCRRYAPPPICEGRLQKRRFCIDRYEYPDQPGVLPVVMVSWEEAVAACRAEHKRLCTASEWTFACEGSERLPYPYGYVRDPTACNIDRHYLLPDLAAFDEPRSVAAELTRVDQRVESGKMPRCVSPFGVHDMTGNVDEWVVNESRDPVVSGLKGGYYGPIRARCRPMTTDHNQWFRFYQVGFRCCADTAPGRADAGPARSGGA